MLKPNSVKKNLNRVTVLWSRRKRTPGVKVAGEQRPLLLTAVLEMNWLIFRSVNQTLKNSSIPRRKQPHPYLWGTASKAGYILKMKWQFKIWSAEIIWNYLKLKKESSHSSNLIKRHCVFDPRADRCRKTESTAVEFQAQRQDSCWLGTPTQLPLCIGLCRHDRSVKGLPWTVVWNCSEARTDWPGRTLSYTLRN